MNKKLALMARAEEQVYDKIKNDTFHAIVNRAFMGALPMDRSELNKDSVREISRFSKAALEAAGGYSLLENAIENTTVPAQRSFLEDIRDICESSARMVSDRVAREAGGMEGSGNGITAVQEVDDSGNTTDTTSTNTATTEDADNDIDNASPTDPSNDTDTTDDTDEDDDESIDDVKAPDDTKPVPLKPQVIRQGIPFKDLVADAKMTDEEYERYVRMRGRLDLPEVSKLINHKVTQAMLAEKETYRMIDEANQKLKDAITDKADDEGDIITEDQAEEIKESVLELPLKNSPREHLSVFSKLQTAAVEAVLCENDIDINRPNADVMLDVLTNYTFDIFGNKKEPTLEQTLNRLVNYKTAVESCEGCNDDPCRRHQLMNLGTAFATIIYTFLQALYSMNLVNITPCMARHMCDKCGPLGDRDPRKMGHTVDDQVRAALETEGRVIRKTDSVPQLESQISQLHNFKKRLEGVTEMGIPVSTSIFAKIDSLTNEALSRKAKYESSLEAALIPRSSSVVERNFETDKYEMNKVPKSFRNTPIDKLVFKCTEGASLIDVIGLCNGRAVKSTSVALESNYNVPTASYLKMLVKSSDLGNANFGDVKPAIESWIDGKHTSLR